MGTEQGLIPGAGGGGVRRGRSGEAGTWVGVPLIVGYGFGPVAKTCRFQ